MRLVTAIVGILISIPPLILFAIGTQTFVDGWERALAIGIVIESGALLAMSIALLSTPSLQRIQNILLVTTIATMAAVVAAIAFLE